VSASWLTVASGRIVFRHHLYNVSGRGHQWRQCNYISHVIHSRVDINRFADNAGDVVAGDDVITGHVTRGGTPIVRDTATARLTSNADDDAWEV